MPSVLVHLDDEIRIERGILVDAITRITPRIAHDAGAVDPIVETVMGVPVDPQLHPVRPQQVRGVGHEAGVEQRASESRVDAVARRLVVSREAIQKKVALEKRLADEERRKKRAEDDLAAAAETLHALMLQAGAPTVEDLP